jgi:thioesterase domain-containing protein
MLVEVQRELNAGKERLDPAGFFEQPTVAALARLLSNMVDRPDGPSPVPHILPLRRRGSRLPFFCFAPDYLDPYYLRHLGKCLGDDQPFYIVCPPQPVSDNRLLKVEELARLLVAAIQDVSPRGPYLLGGHCYGGVVAFEAAAQLLARGEEITRLVLFDVPTPGYPKVVRKWRRYLRESRRMCAAALRGEPLAQAAEVLRHIHRLAHIFQRRFGGRATRAVASVRTEVLASPQNPKVLVAFSLWEYVPRDLPVPIVQFLAAEETVSTNVLDDPRLGWRDFARAGIEVFATPGGHASMLDAQNTPAIAAQLEPLLRKVTQTT